MLDTVILQIPRGRYEIFEHHKFIPPTTRMLDNNLPYFKYINNPMAIDRSRKVYKPRVTIHKRGKNFNLTIEFSASKVLFNNNLDELEDKDFEEVLKKLKDKLFAMGIIVNINTLKNAEVLSFHPSKNIRLTKGYTASFAIRELYKTDTSKRFDISKIKFKNNGEELQYYTNSHSIVFYDKVADLANPEKRAVDKQQTIYQRSLFDYLKEKNKTEILRMEIRLSKKVKMNEILQRVNYAPNPLFKDVFQKDLCKRIIDLYWGELFNKNLFLYNTNSPQEVLQIILAKYPKTKILKALTTVGLYVLCKDDEGVRGFRQIVDSHKSNINWAVVKTNLKKFDNEFFAQSTWGFLKDIKNEINTFGSFRVDKSGQIK